MSLQTPAFPDASPARAEAGLLRLATAGSVDDGKSTLVGRLLHDTRAVFADQLEAVARASRERGRTETDLALLTDGLRAEREQGITIDVAYRYFATPRRRFILADTPGHVQYTRNMVTGASTAQLAVILVDARHGVVEQTRRHAAVAALLRVPHVVLAVNKMDLVGFDEKVFADIAEEFAEHAERLGLGGPDGGVFSASLDGAHSGFLGGPHGAVHAIPVSALRGDNVVRPSAESDWYGGPTLLEHLEAVPTESAEASAPARLPVQYVIRPQTEEFRDYRGYAGRLASGTLAVGDEIVVAPSGRRSSVAAIDVLGTPAERAVAGQSITVRLADDLDVSRGDLIASAQAAPEPAKDLTATVCHLVERPLRVGQRVLVKHTTRTVQALVREIPARLDIGTLTSVPHPGELAANDIGTVVLRTATPLAVDPYAENRQTGAFLVIDPQDGATLTAGMVCRAVA